MESCSIFGTKSSGAWLPYLDYSALPYFPCCGYSREEYSEGLGWHKERIWGPLIRLCGNDINTVNQREDKKMSPTFYLLEKGVMGASVEKNFTQRWVSIESSGVHPISLFHFWEEHLVDKMQSTPALESLSQGLKQRGW